MKDPLGEIENATPPPKISNQIEKQLQRALQRGVESPRFSKLDKAYIEYAKNRWTELRKSVSDFEFKKRKIDNQIYTCNTNGKEFNPNQYRYDPALFKYATDKWNTAIKPTDKGKVYKQINKFIKDLIATGETLRETHLEWFDVQYHDEIKKQWNHSYNKTGEVQFKKNYVKTLIRNAISKGRNTMPDFSTYSGEIRKFGEEYWKNQSSKKTSSEKTIAAETHRINNAAQRGKLDTYRISEGIDADIQQKIQAHLVETQSEVTAEEMRRREIETKIKEALNEGQTNIPNFSAFSDAEQQYARSRWGEERQKISNEELLQRKVKQRLRGGKNEGAKNVGPILVKKYPELQEKAGEIQEAWEKKKNEHNNEELLGRRAKKRLQGAKQAGREVPPDISFCPPEFRPEITEQWQRYIDTSTPANRKAKRVKVAMNQHLRSGNTTAPTLEGIDNAKEAELTLEWGNKIAILSHEEIQRRKINRIIENAITRGQRREPNFSHFSKEERQYASQQWKSVKKDISSLTLEKRRIRQRIHSNVAHGTRKPLARIMKRESKTWKKRWAPYIRSVWRKRTKDMTEEERQKNVAKTRVVRAIWEGKEARFEGLTQEVQKFGM